jgi:predicted nuclease of predicted toxin-antitoxin system
VKRLLLDQGLPRSAANLLGRAGWDVVHVADIGMSRADDRDILQKAREEARTCVTLDADFHSLLATGGQPGPSVVRIRKQGLDADALAALYQVSEWLTRRPCPPRHGGRRPAIHDFC